MELQPRMLPSSGVNVSKLALGWEQRSGAERDVWLVLCFCSLQYMQVQDQPAQMWNQAQAALQKMQMPIKQQQQAFYMAAQDPLKLYEHQLQPPTQPQLSNMDKKIKYPDVKMQDFYWEPSYRMGESLPVMADRMKRSPPGGICSDQDASRPRGPPFEVSSSPGTVREEELVLSCPAAFLSLCCSPLFFSVLSSWVSSYEVNVFVAVTDQSDLILSYLTN